MLAPLYVDLEGKSYPRLILGSDRFVDIFPKPRPPEQLEEAYIYDMMEGVVKYGVAGFDLNTMSENVLSAFARLQGKHGEAVVGIGDPNWKCGYMLRDQHLWDIKPRVIRTLVESHMDQSSRALVAKLPEKNRRFWFNLDPQAEPLSQSDIDEIYINEEEWLSRVRRIQPLADFCLFGADYADWMLLFGRQDLLLWQLNTIRDHDLIPVAVFHWTSLSMPKLDSLPVGAHWTLGNLEAMYLSTQEAVRAIRAADNPVTCFRTLRGISVPDEIRKAFEWLHFEVGAQGFVLGVDNLVQARETCTIAHSVLSTETRE